MIQKFIITGIKSVNKELSKTKILGTFTFSNGKVSFEISDPEVKQAFEKALNEFQQELKKTSQKLIVAPCVPIRKGKKIIGYREIKKEIDPKHPLYSVFFAQQLVYKVFSIKGWELDAQTEKEFKQFLTEAKKNPYIAEIEDEKGNIIYRKKNRKINR